MKKYLTILGVIVFIVFLRINFKTANTYNSYLKNIYFNFLGIFTKNNTLEVSYTNEELEILELKKTINELSIARKSDGESPANQTKNIMAAS